ncbi:MAG: nucleoside triphosphate pyrophosphohydrolase [Eubacteriales bacterium]|nr:nucleoside triphosphate pyrophosphohydrolase [Eubacteriales bacterium]
MHTITVAALGPGHRDLVTLGAYKQMQRAGCLVLRTSRHGVARLLEEEGIAFTTLDELHDKSPDFDAFAREAAGHVLSLAGKRAVTYAVADPARDETVRLIREQARDFLRVLPGVPLENAFISQADTAGPVLVSSAVSLEVYNAQQPLAVVELNSRALAGDVKLKLLPVYGEIARVLFFAPGEQAARRGAWMALPEIDRQRKYDHTAGFIVFPVPLLEKTAFDPEDLLAIMRRLRGKDGCPWDKKQTHGSLAKYLVEEANEAAAELVQGNWAHAAEELGDVFLQLAFHAVVGEEQGTLSWGEMLESICAKLIRRHPHIFGEMKLDTAEGVKKTWDEIKQAERGEASPGEAMQAVPASFPPMMRAEKVQAAAARVGFDWKEAAQVLEKVEEEAEELRQALGDPEKALEELGDLLFACVNTARLMGVSGGQALNLATEKFIRRFLWMENAIKSDKKALKMLTSLDLGVYWERSKMKVQ